MPVAVECDGNARRGLIARCRCEDGSEHRIGLADVEMPARTPGARHLAAYLAWLAAILASSKVVAPVDVIVRLGWLSTADLENWRFGRVPYLERMIRCNLARLSRFLRILGFHCHELNLTASQLPT